MTDDIPAPKRPHGRPPLQMSEPIPGTPENIMRALLAMPSKKDDERPIRPPLGHLHK